MQDETPTTREWCLGLGFVRDRPLDFDELNILRGERDRLTRQGWLWIVIWMLIFGITTAFGLGNSTFELLGDFWAFWIVIGLPACIIGSRLAFIARKTVLKEIELGLVKEFEAEVPPGSESVAQAQSLTLLSATNRLWKINGEDPQKKWQTLPVAEVAATPEYAGIAAQWLNPVPETGNLHLEAGIRELSDAERNEIRQYVRSVYVRMTPAALVFSCWFGLVLWFGVIHKKAPPDSLSQIRFLILGFAAISIDYSLIRFTSLALKLMHDRKIGRVIIVREAVENELNQPCPTHEVLPRSRRYWTTDGRPAAWRTFGVFSKKR